MFNSTTGKMNASYKTPFSRGYQPSCQQANKLLICQSRQAGKNYVFGVVYLVFNMVPFLAGLC